MLELRASPRQALGDRQAHSGGNLLGLPKIRVGDLLKIGAVESDDALVAVGRRPLIDSHRQDAVAEERGRRCLAARHQFVNASRVSV